MTVTQPASKTDALAAARARNQLVRRMREALHGRGLDIRERNKELVITSPGHLDKGRVHINLATGEASHSRTLWDYLGYLPGYGNGDEDQLGVDADAIAAIFTRPGMAPGLAPDGDAK
jgi:hypothetical protein